MMRIGIVADHGGFELKVQLTAALKAAGYELADFGAHELVAGDDYPDFVVPMARGRWQRVRSPVAWPSAAAG
jgi:ribose 5-phosphate isomerase B